MNTSLIASNNLAHYTLNEAAPIILALAIVIAIGGVTAATILTCGWRGAKSVAINWQSLRLEITCR